MNVMSAQQYLYVRDNVSVRAFLVGNGGTLTPINGWATNGRDQPSPDLNNHTIVIAEPIGRTCVFASDGQFPLLFSGSIAAYTIDVFNGSITPVAGMPFNTGSVTSSAGLTAGRDRLLFATTGGNS
jgi:hypothetical protein